MDIFGRWLITNDDCAISAGTVAPGMTVSIYGITIYHHTYYVQLLLTITYKVVVEADRPHSHWTSKTVHTQPTQLSSDATPKIYIHIYIYLYSAYIIYRNFCIRTHIYIRDVRRYLFTHFWVNFWYTHIELTPLLPFYTWYSVTLG